MEHLPPSPAREFQIGQLSKQWNDLKKKIRQIRKWNEKRRQKKSISRR